MGKGQREEEGEYVGFSNEQHAISRSGFHPPLDFEIHAESLLKFAGELIKCRICISERGSFPKHT